VSKVRAADLKVIQVVRTAWHPIGITYDAVTKSVWVACYGGSIMVFKDVARR
jgi:DNA-binding beta-propeller fold protein YncE